MAISLKYKFESEKSDGDDDALVQPSNWNDEHKLQMASGHVLGRTTSGDGSVEEINAAALAAFLSLGTSDSPQFAGVNLGHATDTTLTRSAAGVVAVEGTPLLRASQNLGDVANAVTARSNLKIVTLTQAAFDALDPPDSNAIYLITDAA